MHVGTWPWRLRCRKPSLRLNGQSLSGGRSIAGTTQTIALDAGYWLMDLNEVVLRDRFDVLAWRQVEGKLQGRANTIDIPVCDITRPPGVPADFVPHSDGAPFSDDTLYSSGGPFAVLGVTAAAGGTELAILTLEEVWLHGGETLSLEHAEPWGNRVYRVTDVTLHSTEGNVVTITPPLRAEALAGSRVELVRPVCRMKLVADDGMATELDMARRASPSVAFVEDI